LPSKAGILESKHYRKAKYGTGFEKRK